MCKQTYTDARTRTGIAIPFTNHVSGERSTPGVYARTQDDNAVKTQLHMNNTMATRTLHRSQAVLPSTAQEEGPWPFGCCCQDGRIFNYLLSRD